MDQIDSGSNICEIWKSAKSSINTVGWWNFRQTCPLVSGVEITGQTKSRADVTIGKADQGW